jgi:flavin reductase (DIM6/NTAB) family NADH-FMN oxidoreductase RutF
MESQLLNAFGLMTYGIYVLTTRYENHKNGMIASWVSQASYDPPLIMVAVHPDRYSHKLLQKSGCFALHVLGQDQKKMINRFKGQDPAEKFAGLAWEAGEYGPPILKDCLAWFECTVKEQYTPGNHTLFLGAVDSGGFIKDGVSLCTRDYEKIYRGKT